MNFINRFFKLGLWSPFSLFIQISFSYILSGYFGIQFQLSFILAVIGQIQINYLISTKFIFYDRISFSTYFRFITSSGISRLLDIAIFFISGILLDYIFQIITATIMGALIRFILFEFYVFEKKNIKK